VAHGGLRHAAPVRIDREVLASLSQLSSLAPLHQPPALDTIEAIAAAAPRLPQVACFDTAFHRTQPSLAQTFPLPRRFSERGVRRYGFHGLSFDYVASRMRQLAPDVAHRKMVIAHLGAGSSLCGVLGGQSVASTMGFTPADGLMMGTRCGSLDPGVMIHLMDAYRMDARALEALIYHQSGLLGVSGISSDMRVLRASTEAAADEAIALFVYRVVREIGSMAAALGGVDAIVFTGGIGENDPMTRSEIAAGCAWLGLELAGHDSGLGARRISRNGASPQAWVVPTDEERVVARHTAAVLNLA
jgi:acetate kinase